MKLSHEPTLVVGSSESSNDWSIRPRYAICQDATWTRATLNASAVVAGRGFGRGRSIRRLASTDKFEAGSFPARALRWVRDELDEGQSGFGCGVVSRNGRAIDNEALQRRGQQPHQRDAFGRLHFADEIARSPPRLSRPAPPRRGSRP